MGGTALGASGRSNNGLKLDVKTGKLSLWRLFPAFTYQDLKNESQTIFSWMSSDITDTLMFMPRCADPGAVLRCSVSNLSCFLAETLRGLVPVCHGALTRQLHSYFTTPRRSFVSLINSSTTRGAERSAIIAGAPFVDGRSTARLFYSVAEVYDQRGPGRGAKVPGLWMYTYHIFYRQAGGVGHGCAGQR